MKWEQLPEVISFRATKVVSGASLASWSLTANLVQMTVRLVLERRRSGTRDSSSKATVSEGGKQKC